MRVNPDNLQKERKMNVIGLFVIMNDCDIFVSFYQEKLHSRSQLQSSNGQSIHVDRYYTTNIDK